MKQYYQEPKLEVLTVSAEDVVRTSGGFLGEVDDLTRLL